MFKKKLPVLLQKSQYECGIMCISMLLSYELSFTVNPQKLKGSQDEQIGRDGTSLKKLTELTENVGFKLKSYYAKNLLNEIENCNMKTPCMVHWNNNHFVILERVNKKLIQIIDPAVGRKNITIEEFDECYSGTVVKLESDQKLGKLQKRELQVENLAKKIGRYLFSEKKFLILVIILSILFQSLNAITPFITEYLIDSFMAQKENAIRYDFLAILIVSITIIFLGVSLLRMIFIIKLQVSINKRLTTSFVKKIFSLPLSFFEANSSGDIASRIHNISAVREIISRLASTLILDISLLLVFCGVMLYYSPMLSVIVFVGALIQVLATVFLLPKIEMYTKQEVHGQAQYQGQLIEVLRSATFIKTIGDTQKIETQMNDIFEQQLGNFSKRMHVSSLLGSVSSSINISLPLIILVFGVWIGTQNGLTIGAIVAFSTIAGRFMTPLGSIIGSIQSIKVVEEMIDRIEYVLLEKEEKLNPESNIIFNPNVDVIKFKDVSFGYDKSHNILSEINLEIYPREKVFLIGKTGSGKSTLLKLIAGLYQPTIGQVYIGENNLNDVNIQKLRSDVGFIVQDVQLFNDTIMNNIKYYFDNISEEAVIQAAKDAEIHEDIMKLKMGYQTVIGENGISLSGGQRQRLSIARVLVKNPKLLIIDEGTSNLDTTTERKVLNNIYARDITIITITHRISAIENYDTIYELHNGKLYPKDVETEKIEITG
ncbi:peptidase domain-containing ABC transporter [Gracilibacillus thailandensis]|uniref:ATP-binding cassette domain-containing protein n=1 Tax=Gracilibacillus thailandensis TaxID=563735 RepID=A0A6N7QYX5_9BACI|nr:peptidase domain-containing ABC transporter [Gracilibacillus thailandensis]MRI65900.1 ATP-binding cassette domain-containing protein [Gracilibacillus thailandensis]